MIKKIFLLCFFNVIIVNAQDLEANIYDALDAFLATKTENAFKELTEKEKIFENQVTGKNEHLALVILQCNKAFFLKEQNKITEAVVTYESAWKRYASENLSNYDIISYCLQPLGNLYTITKDFANAEYLIKYYISLATQKKETTQQIAGVINLAIVYEAVNRPELVVQLVDEVLQQTTINTTQKNRLLKIRAHNLSVLGEKKVKGFKGDITKIWNDKDVYYFNYKESLQKGAYEEAKSFFFSFKNETSDTFLNHRDKAKLFLEEAQLHILLDEKEKAQATLDSVLPCLLPKYNDNTKVDLKQLFAESLFTDLFDMKAILASSSEEALSYYDKSFYVADLIVQQITSKETKIILQANRRKRSEACILLLLDKYNETQDVVFLEKALFYANIGKSDVLKETLFKRQLRKKHPNDSLLLIEKKLLQQQEVLSNRVLEVQKASNNSDTISKLNSALTLTSINIKKVQVSIREKYNTSEKDVHSLAQIQAKIGKENQVLLLYFYGNKNIYQFLVDEKTIKVNIIKVDDRLTETITTYIQLFNSPTTINNNVSNFTKKAFEIYDRLKFEAISAHKNVMIIPDGILNFVPFETLLTSKTATTFFAKMPFIIKKHKIGYSFNLTTLLTATDHLKDKSILGMFPVFKNTTKELKHSLKEATVIEDTFQAITFKNEAATKKSFLTALDKTAIIHLSTHSGSTGASISPFISFYDKDVTVNELYAEESTASLVVLSACETGIGTLFKGSSPLSIARAFNYIGVNNLVFSLWKINDKSTSLLMEDFYQVLKETSLVSEANHQSKINYLQDKTIENYKKSPYYWGAFVNYGAFSLPKKNTYTIYIVLFFTLVIVLGLQILKRKI